MRRWLRANTKMIALASLFVVGFVLLIGANAVIYERAAEKGARPVSIAPTTPAVVEDGVDGKSAYEIWLDNGHEGSERDFLESLEADEVPRVSRSELEKAVEMYCARGTCDGKRPTVGQVVEAFAIYCQGDRCEGNAGENAAAVTDAQLGVAVATYCASDRCTGPAGADGAPASPPTAEQIQAQVTAYCDFRGQCKGEAGQPGRTQIMACVLITESNTDVRYYSAKFTDEPDTAFLNWPYRSRLPAWFVPNECIDMRSM